MATKVKQGQEPGKVWTWADCERAMESYAEAKGAEALFASELQEKLTEFQLRFQRELQPQIERARGQAAEQEAMIREFAKAHRKEFKPREEGGDTRSHEHAGVTVGYRFSSPQVRIENEDEAVEWLIRHDHGAEFVRTRLEANREALREMLGNDSDPRIEKFAAHGITLQQKDKFFIEVRNGNL